MSMNLNSKYHQCHDPQILRIPFSFPLHGISLSQNIELIYSEIFLGFYPHSQFWGPKPPHGASDVPLSSL